jgi:hypothetical protein
MTTAVNSPAMQLGPFTLTKTGLESNRVPSLGEWLEAGRRIKLAHKCSLWWLGDWLLSGEAAGIDWASQGGELFDEAEFDLDTLRRARQIAQLFPPSRRRLSLSWSHHRDVSHLEGPDAESLLSSAEVNGWNRAKLRKAVKELVRATPAVQDAEAAPAAERLRAEGSVVCADFKVVLRELPASSAQLILARMPMDQRDVHWYSSLARVAKRVLKDGGSLVMRTGPHLLGEVIQDCQAHLRFWWVCGAEKNASALNGIGVAGAWLPWVWFVKDAAAEHPAFSDWMPRNGEEEDGAEAASYFIEFLSAPGDLVIDPYCGAGAVLEVAARAGRKVLGVDLTETGVRAARRRLGIRG